MYVKTYLKKKYLKITDLILFVKAKKKHYFHHHSGDAGRFPFPDYMKCNNRTSLSREILFTPC